MCTRRVYGLVRTREQDGCRHGYCARRPVLVVRMSSAGDVPRSDRGCVAQAMKVWEDGETGVDVQSEADDRVLWTSMIGDGVREECGDGRRVNST
jgi:hypothetical protein